MGKRSGELELLRRPFTEDSLIVRFSRKITILKLFEKQLLFGKFGTD